MPGSLDVPFSDVTDAVLLDAARALSERALGREGDLPPLREAEDLRRAICLALPTKGRPFAEVVQLLDAALLHTPATSGSRFVNQLFGGREPAGTLGELLSVVVNSSMYTLKAGGAQILVEDAVLEKMLVSAGFPRGEGGFFPGGSLSNFAALLAARNALLPDSNEQGLPAVPLTTYASEDAHYSIDKAVAMLGLGLRFLRRIPTDAQGCMCPDALREQVAADRAAGCLPVAVVATSGTTVQGAFDPIDPIANVCEEFGVWLHVDGAWGGSFLLHPSARGRLAGLHRAHSFTWDAHKMLGVPLSCSVALFRETGHLHKAFSQAASYLFQLDGEALNPGIRSLQCGRRNDALKLWATWQHLGDEGFAARLDRQLALTRAAVERVRSEPTLRLVREPQCLNVCFAAEGVAAESLCALLDREGDTKVSWGLVDGRPIVRLILVNPELTTAALDRFFAALLRAADRLRAGAETPPLPAPGRAK